jgi:uncharacterized protein YggL (DUF469 family)
MQIDVEKLNLSCTLFPAVTKTDGWKEINGATNTGNSTHSTRRLKPKKYCDNFQFEYSIDGNVTTLNLEQWNQKLNKIQRVVETVTLLNNPSFTGGEEKQVEVAIRMLGCQTIKGKSNRLIKALLLFSFSLLFP